jgi:hypothetical protein
MGEDIQVAHALPSFDKQEARPRNRARTPSQPSRSLQYDYWVVPRAGLEARDRWVPASRDSKTLAVVFRGERARL